MGSAFNRLSQELKQHPLRTNMILSTFIGFCGDIMCQTVYDPFFGVTRVSPTSLPPESFASPLILRVPSMSLVWKKYWGLRKNAGGAASQSANSQATPCSTSATTSSSSKNNNNNIGDIVTLSAPIATTTTSSSFNVDGCMVYLDLRRSFIFCSFSCLFSVPYFLWVYRHLDRFCPPAHVTKLQAIGKGFASYCAANLTTPLYMAHITFLDRFFIFRDGRDGRRRVHRSHEERDFFLFTNAPTSMKESCARGSSSASESRSRDGSQKSHISSSPSVKDTASTIADPSSVPRYSSVPLVQTLKSPPPPSTIILENEKSFNKEEYLLCVHHDWKKRIRHDFPDVLRCGIVFWGINWLPMFYYIPPHFRLLYSAMLQTVWSGVMSYMMHRGER